MVSTTSTDPENFRSRQEFGAALTELRERAGLSVRDVAKATGLSVSTVGGYFSGKHVPPVKPAGVLLSILRACLVTDEVDLRRWDDALLRIRRTPGPRPAGARAPYRGLAAFDVDDASWFFGREGEARSVLARLQQLATAAPQDLANDHPPRMVAIVGASGSGKSSLLRAGVVAAVRAGESLGCSESHAVIITPGRQPLATLEASLSDTPPDEQILLVVDQFEELFTLCPDEAERHAFVGRLVALAATRAVVVLGLRADFYRHATAHRKLRPVLEHAQIVLGPMDADQLRRVIVEPALQARIELEEGLVDVLLADLPAEAGALPLLSHVLLTMWRTAGRSRLTVADYRATGGVRAAVTGTAEHAHGELTPPQREAARRLFLRLVAIGDDTADTRRRIEPSELEAHGLDDDLQVALATFVDHRLITADAFGIEITHEVLLDAWPRLRGWVDGDRAGLRLRRQITEAARLWEELDHDASSLFRGARLEVARQWLEGRDLARELTGVERAFLDASTERQQSEHRREQRQTRRLRRATVTLAALLVLALGLGAWSARLTTTSSRDRDLALSRQVAAASDRLRSTDTSLAAQLAAIAYEQAPTAEARSALLDSSATATARRYPGPRGILQAVSMSSDGRVVVGGSESGTVRIWTANGSSTPSVIDVQHPGAGTVFATALSSNAHTLAAGGVGGVRLWDISDPGHPALLPPLPLAPTTTVFSLAVAGDLLAVAGVEGALGVWDIHDPRSPVVVALLAAGSAELHSVAFGPTGRLLAAGAADGAIRLWSLANISHLVPVPHSPAGPTATVFSLAFSPDGTHLAAGSADKTAYLWSVPADGSAWSPATRLPGPTAWVNAVAFSPDGTRVAAGSSDSKAWQWDTADHRVVASYPHPGPVTSVAYVGADLLATAAADGAARVWPARPPHVGVKGTHYSMAYSADGKLLAAGAGANEAALVDARDPAHPVLVAPALLGPGGAARLAGASALTTDGTLFATGGKDGSILLWDTTEPGRPRPVGGPFDADGAVVETLAFSPDGRTLAACGDDSQVRLWNVADRAHPVPLGPPLTPGGLVFAVTFSPDGHRLAAGTSSHAVIQWDVTDPATPKPLGPPVTSAESYVFGLAYSPDGRLLAATSADRSVWVLDVAAPEHVTVRARLTDATNYEYGVAFSPDGRTLAASSADGQVRLWRVPAGTGTFERVATLSAAAGSEVMAITFSPDGGTLVAGNATGLVFWRTDAGTVKRDVCTGTGAPLSRDEWQVHLPGRAYDPPCPASH